MSFLDGNGTPAIVERALIRPPAARIGTITPEERKAIIAASPLKGKYDQTLDSEFGFRGAATASQGRHHDRDAAGAKSTKSAAGTAAKSGLGSELRNRGAASRSSRTRPAGGGMAGRRARRHWRHAGRHFRTSRPRGTRLSTGQLVAREITRSVTNRVAGQIAADIGKSLGGSTGGTIGRAIVRGTLGGILRR